MTDLEIRKFKQCKFLIDAFHITLTTNVWVIQLTTFSYFILWEQSKALITSTLIMGTRTVGTGWGWGVAQLFVSSGNPISISIQGAKTLLLPPL